MIFLVILIWLPVAPKQWFVLPGEALGSYFGKISLSPTWSGTGWGGAAAAHSQYCCLQKKEVTKLFQFKNAQEKWPTFRRWKYRPWIRPLCRLGFGVRGLGPRSLHCPGIMLGLLSYSLERFSGLVLQRKIEYAPWNVHLCRTAEKESGKLYSLTTLRRNISVCEKMNLN